MRLPELEAAFRLPSDRIVYHYTTGARRQTSLARYCEALFTWS